MEAVEQELWQRYRLVGDQDARDYLFLRYSPWAKGVAASVVRRVGPSMMEWSDHLQNAHVGLLEAMSRYDASRGTDFMAFAKPRVRGAVFNGMRSFSREDSADSRKRIALDRLESLERSEGDNPLDAFVGTVVALGLGLMLESGGSMSSEAAPPDFGEYSSILRDALLDLPARRREILIAHYIRQVPFQEIAKGMRVTKGRVSQLHKEALMRLRQTLKDRRYDREYFF